MSYIMNMWTLCFKWMLHKLVEGFEDVTMNDDNLGPNSTLFWTIKNATTLCNYISDIQKGGIRKKLVLTHGFQKAEYCTWIHS